MLTYLALGDSYTIGEQVIAEENFPHQTVAILKDEFKIEVATPKIIAVTGWTTDELNAAIKAENVHDSFDIVTLLIGVNNQYRELSIEEFETDFDFLLRKAIHFSGEKPQHVIVLSIPDWGVTPFGVRSKNINISSEIDTFNAICESAAKNYGTHFINITEQTRSASEDKELLANDELHYSGKSHGVWAEKVAAIIQSQIHTERSHA